MKRLAMGVGRSLSRWARRCSRNSNVSAQAPGPTSGEQLCHRPAQPAWHEGRPGRQPVRRRSRHRWQHLASTVDGAEHLVGNTGRISMIDVETGERTTVADDLPSDFGTATMD